MEKWEREEARPSRIGKRHPRWSASCFRHVSQFSTSIHHMAISFKQFLCGTAALLCGLCVAQAQTSVPVSPPAAAPAERPRPAQPVIEAPASTVTTDSTRVTLNNPAAANPAIAHSNDSSPLVLVQASTGPAPAANAAKPAGTPSAVMNETAAATESGGVGVREFQGDDVGQVLRLLARQAKINMVVSEAVVGTVTMRLEDVTALQAIGIIVKAKSLFMDNIDNVYYIKTAAERTAEPTESDSYQFSYARAKDVMAVIAPQMTTKEGLQFDERTNTLFFRETRSNIDNIRKMLVQIDKPTKQVMIEARLVEVTANPKQSFGINWAGVVGSSTAAKTFSYGAASSTAAASAPASPTGGVILNDFAKTAHSVVGSLMGQTAILSVPQMSLTMRALNEDSDAEFLANPRIVTADNQKATIKIIRKQPVPKLNFNEQTATAEFSGFEEKEFGNTLTVTPLINKDDFITLAVHPEISNKIGDQPFFPPGASDPVLSPIIDTRELDSNVLIKSGDTLAIGGLLQDEVNKSRSKVPLLGDIPVLGYFFQERLNARTKRNLLVFVTPTIIDQHYGTGLEDQVSGLHHTGEEYADPNGWRNNAKGAVRLVPTSNRQVVADYPKPGMAPAPATSARRVEFMSSAKDRDF